MVALRELMNPNVVAVAPSASIADAAARMIKARVGSAVVRDVLVGIVLTGTSCERQRRAAT
jgi:CBS domain-containing protein